MGYAALALAGLVAGWVNTLAGGGSLLSVPALMWYGLPADLANGTSRIAVLAQGVTATLGFWRGDKLDAKLLLPVAVPSVLGALFGAYAASAIPNQVLKPLLVATLVIMAATMFLKPQSFAPPPGVTPQRPTNRPLALLSLFGAGFYGGFLQAGVGIVLLFVFARLLQIDLVRGNGLKVAVIFLYSIVVVLIFAARAQVAWHAGAALALGQMAGALAGVRFSIRMGQDVVQRVLFVVIVGLTLTLLLK